MLRIAVVEDDRHDQQHLVRCLRQYADTQQEEFYIRVFDDGADLLKNEKIDFDILFLDIEMEHIGGMETARILRETDQVVCIIFVTNISKYAIQSYEVSAFDYVMKPVHYEQFASKMKKAIHYVQLHKQDYIWIGDKDGLLRLPAAELYYLEKDKNYLVYHTSQGEYRERGTMTEMADKLAGKGFAKINSGCMVNMLHVTGYGHDTVRLRGQDLPVSRQMRKAFQEILMDYIRDGAGA